MFDVSADVFVLVLVMSAIGAVIGFILGHMPPTHTED